MSLQILTLLILFFNRLFLPNIFAPNILSSYKSMSGRAIMTWLTTSGGVRRADPIKKRRSANFLFFFRIFLVVPWLERKFSKTEYGRMYLEQSDKNCSEVHIKFFHNTKTRSHSKYSSSIIFAYLTYP